MSVSRKMFALLLPLNDDVYRAEGHTEVDISWKGILMTVTCLGFCNIEDFYVSCNFGWLCWIFLDIVPTCCAHQNLCMTFSNILGLLQKCSTWWKSCVNEQYPKKLLFGNFYLTSWFVTWGQKEGVIYLSPWNPDR